MLKRAVFGILGPSVAPRGPRNPAALAALPTPATVKPPTKSEKASKIYRRKGKYKADIEEESDSSEEINTSMAETHDGSDEDEGWSPSQDPRVRRALIRRAAALYAQDSKGFLLAMQKHEQPGGEDEEDGDIELLDPECDQSGAEETTAQRIAGGSTGPKLAVGLEQEEVSQDEEFKRGKFHCKLCPEKVFIFEADLEKHLESKVKRND